ncbi:MAG: hypothetical protein EPN94_00655 [Nitrospirae bacterium]|nr:MAG: hypothetical protein EPN94_00655 [Nitrospirota bacterium]
MDIIFIDYSEAYYSGTTEKIPDIITGKFVQIRNSQTEYLVFAPKEFAPYHANIVERFCMDRGIKGAYVGEEKRFDIREPGWEVVGGGKFDIDKTRKQIRLFDNSLAYGKFDSKGLPEKIRSTDRLSEYQVVIY